MFLLLTACFVPPPSSTESTPPDDTGTCATCELTVSEARYDCDGGDSGEERTLSVEVDGGQVTVTDMAFSVGCCPDFGATATFTVETSTVEIVYTLENDICDCICDLDLFTTVEDVPSGDWTLLVHGEELAFSVP
ncbi:MAG TPA: hypothetical protein QGF58_03785 [Myxococcota bacterium]|nr:hypothetical protein [Myxococcota bacterium]